MEIKKKTHLKTVNKKVLLKKKTGKAIFDEKTN